MCILRALCRAQGHVTKPVKGLLSRRSLQFWSSVQDLPLLTFFLCLINFGFGCVGVCVGVCVCVLFLCISHVYTLTLEFLCMCVFRPCTYKPCLYSESNFELLGVYIFVFCSCVYKPCNHVYSLTLNLLCVFVCIPVSYTHLRAHETA